MVIRYSLTLKNITMKSSKIDPFVNKIKTIFTTLSLISMSLCSKCTKQFSFEIIKRKPCSGMVSLQETLHQIMNTNSELNKINSKLEDDVNRLTIENLTLSEDK